jgi:hypothetical protein
MSFDVLRAKYYPETVVDYNRLNLAASETEIMRQVSFDPYVLFLKSIAVDSALDVNIQVIIDGSEIVTNDSAASGGLDVPMEINQLVESSLVINGKGNTGVVNDVPIRVTFVVDKLATYDKIFYGEFVSKSLREKAKSYGIQARTLAGIQSKISANRWMHTREVSKSFTGLTVDQNPNVGTIVDTPYIKDIDDNIIETKVVLLGVSCDRTIAAGGDNYISVTRGENEEDYVKLDGRTMMGLEYWEDLFIPARDRLDIVYKNGALATGKIKFRYGIAPISIREKIKWGIPLQDFEEDAISTLKTTEGIDVYEMIDVGLL